MRLIEGLDALLALDLPRLVGDGPQSHSVVAVGVFDDQYDHRWRLRRDPPGYRYNWLGFRLARTIT